MWTTRLSWNIKLPPKEVSQVMETHEVFPLRKNNVSVKLQPPPCVSNLPRQADNPSFPPPRFPSHLKQRFLSPFSLMFQP